jgi:hypothetical protein
MVRTVRPIGYTIPIDGPVGKLVCNARISHIWPTHIHFDHKHIVIHLFQDGDQSLDPTRYLPRESTYGRGDRRNVSLPRETCYTLRTSQMRWSFSAGLTPRAGRRGVRSLHMKRNSLADFRPRQQHRSGA